MSYLIYEIKLNEINLEKNQINSKDIKTKATTEKITRHD